MREMLKVQQCIPVWMSCIKSIPLPGLYSLAILRFMVFWTLRPLSWSAGSCGKHRICITSTQGGAKPPCWQQSTLLPRTGRSVLTAFPLPLTIMNYVSASSLNNAIPWPSKPRRSKFEAYISEWHLAPCVTLWLSLDSCRGPSRSGRSAAVRHSPAAQWSAGGAVEMCGLSPCHQVTSPKDPRMN